MKKRIKISNLGRKKEFKMEKRVKISNLGRKREFKMEKTVEISILRRKIEFKMEKRVKTSNFKIKACKCALTSTISYNKKPLLWMRVIRKS